MTTVTTRFNTLDSRRRELGISYSALAALSGVSQPALQRLLTGKVEAPALTSVEAVARVLGIGAVRFLENGSIDFEPRSSAEALRKCQAWRKAGQLVGLAQGATATEGQEVEDVDYQAMVVRTYHELLSGSNQRLWSCKALDDSQP
jgi:transcriptional regulator with XRE-family HTH domain